MMRSRLIWPALLIVSSVAASMAEAAPNRTGLHTLVLFWFVLVCPGLAVVQFLNMREWLVEWTIAVGLSLGLVTGVASLVLYAGQPLLDNTFRFLIAFCVVCALLRFFTGLMRLATQRLPTPLSVPTDR